MPASPIGKIPPPASACHWLQHGQSLEATGTPGALTEAVECYDRAIDMLQARSSAPEPGAIRELARAWMNRGNALQKQAHADALTAAVAAYDQAITQFARLPVSTDPTLGNSLGAAWLNRGHALLQSGRIEHHTAAIASLEQAVALLSRLPVETGLSYRLNLAGAQTNLAQALLDFPAQEQAHRFAAFAAAGTALRLSAQHESQRAGFAEVGLKARRTLCEIIGRWLVENRDPARETSLLATASDAVDTGMVLARHWEALDVPLFRPLAARLFRFGCAYYRRHQPYFLADFVLENLDPAHTSDACPANLEWQTIARENLTAARAELRTQHLHFSGDATTERRLQALHDIEAALSTLAATSTVSLPA
jgi:hypothetical protein